MFDPKSVLDDVIGILREEVAVVQHLTDAQKESNIREYDDEFKNPDVDWKFTAPAIFAAVPRAVPRGEFADGTNMFYDYEMVVFICHDGSDAGNTHILDVVKQVHDALDGEPLEEGDDTVTIRCGAMDFVDKNKKISVYTLEIKTIA